jgi:small subunit ribosomal protein S6
VNTMVAYETMFIINTKLDEEATNAMIEKFKGIMTNMAGEIVKVDIWGKRRLAYEINDMSEGFYVLIDFNGDAALVNELDRVFKITEGILRHIIIRKDK